MRSNLSLGHFVTMTSLKTLFDQSSGIKFLTSIKLNLIPSRGALYISGCLGLVILGIDLPTGSLLVYVSAIFLPTCVCFSTRGLFGHLVEKTFSPSQHCRSLVYSFRCVAVCNTSGKPINVWIQELNDMYPQKYDRGTTLLTE